MSILIKKNLLSNQWTLCWACAICDTYVELFDLFNVNEINHLDMIDYQYNATFDDETMLNYIYILLKQMKMYYKFCVFICCL
jgi:hypothetical protein